MVNPFVKEAAGTELDTGDMQGLIAMGYDQLPSACYLVLQINTNDHCKPKEFIKELLQENLITRADPEKMPETQKSGKILNQAMHIAFTSSGLRKMGTDENILATFSRPFTEGMADKVRSEFLGDIAMNDPCNWEWGNEKQEADILLLCYAKTEEKLGQMITDLQFRFKKHNLALLHTEKTYEHILLKHKIIIEHFGFKDGISAPEVLKEIKKKTTRKTRFLKGIKPGEFVLGYKNEYNAFTERPVVRNNHPAAPLLPDANDKAGYKDLGINGTYLVFRKIAQDVYSFWEYMKKNSIEEGDTLEERAIHLAAKMVGRWPGGAPLSISKTDNFAYAHAKEFSFSASDPNGFGCPFGAHIRRTNPRDQLHSGRDTAKSRAMVKKHQLLRRGRSYGRPLAESMKPEDYMAVAKDDKVPRGLYFICLNADINRQFEFIQNVWVNNTKFADLHNGRDLILSPCHSDFTVQAKGLNRVYKDVPPFTRVMAGAYFFLPGLRALAFLSS